MILLLNIREKFQYFPNRIYNKKGRHPRAREDPAEGGKRLDYDLSIRFPLRRTRMNATSELS